jgi:hypothetical protein
MFASRQATLESCACASGRAGGVMDTETASATKLGLRRGAAGTNAAPPPKWPPIILVLTHSSLPTPVTPSLRPPTTDTAGDHGASLQTQRIVPCG